ncbi:histidine triad (HIT) protein [Caldivirga maquilingensis IC-167]|uniref:Histidine triad (HIT) protein n=2 Tax=Caldivirga maquilingensis TaxID=76887 RepID=A8M8Y3_CALMQ|nr:histidine triad (HIT) protein [Caldivirga maquilingensis IC-167]
MDECIFCRIIGREAPGHVVYEDDDVIAILDKYPINKGHILVMPKRHYRDIFEIPPEALCKVMKVAKLMARAVVNGLKADGVRLIQNNGPSAGQVVFHFHVHVIPYYGGGYRAHRVELSEAEAIEVVSKVTEALRKINEDSSLKGDENTAIS